MNARTSKSGTPPLTLLPLAGPCPPAVYKDHITLSDYEIHDDKCLSRGCRGGQQNNRGCPASTCALQQWLPPLRGVLLILAASSIGDFCCHCCCSGNSFHCRLLHPLARMGLELYYN